MARGKQTQPPKKGGPPAPSKGSGKPAPKIPAAPKPKEKKETCIRCYPGMVPTNPDHKLAKCSTLAKYSIAENFPKLWPQYTTVEVEKTGKSGSKKDDENADKIKSKEDAEQLMQLAATKQDTFKGQPVTKRLLEDAFLVTFAGLAVTPPPKTASNTTSAEQTDLAGQGGAPTGQKVKLQNFLLDPIPAAYPKKNEPQYHLAVHQQPNLDTSLIPQSPQLNRPYPGQSTLVATNFVSVSKVPSKLYMYSITFGGTERVKTQKEIEDDNKAAEAKASETQASDLPEGLAGIALGDDAAGEIKRPGEGDGDEKAADSGGSRKVAQRSEKARIFKALADRDEFRNVQWATDYTLLWTLSPLTLTSASDCIITDIVYAKLSGRKHTLDTITFAPLRSVDIGQSTSEAAKRLLDVVDHPDQTNNPQKGAGMRINALNAFLAKEVVSNADVISVGPNKFFIKDDWSNAGKMLNIRRGYFTSIRPGSDSVLLNVNVATSAFYNSIPASQVFSICGNEEEAKALLKGLTVYIRYHRVPHDLEYDPNEEAHRYRVVAGFGRAPELETFKLDTGGETTVQDYFRSLGYEIQKTQLPCISVNIAPPNPQNHHPNSDQHQQKGRGGKAKQDKTPPKIHWIPPELLLINQYQPFPKLLPSNLTDEMIQAAVRHPAKTQHMIMEEGFNLLGLKASPSIFQSLQMEVGDKLIQVPGYLLAPPRIRYGNKTLAVQNASWNPKGAEFVTLPPANGVVPYPLQAPVCTLDYRRVIQHTALADIGQRVSAHMKKNHGIAFAKDSEKKNVYFKLDQACLAQASEDDANGELASDDMVLFKVLDKFLKEHDKIRLAVVILPRKEAKRYGEIKRICDQWLGLHTVCLTEEKLFDLKKRDRNGGPTQKDVDLAQQSNLALKFNMKLRGQNHAVASPNGQTSLFHNIANDTIVFGADVSHAGSEMPFTPSVAAVVANDDKNLGHFPGSVRLQASTQEMIADLENMVYHRLLRFWTVRRTLPARILFYRDGVSEDQFEICRQEEIPQIYHAYQRLLDEVAPGRNLKLRDQVKLTFVVVGKRHHTRFFATSEAQSWLDDGGQPKWSGEEKTIQTRHGEKVVKVKLNGNVKAGLLVDQVITRPTVDHTTDFFLQSHAALQGTSRAGHYSVLEMDGFSLDDIKTLTHAFCYNYQRATKGVSYVGPAYYADRLCERGTVYLKAYTAGRTRPPFEMSQEQKDAKREGAKEYARDIAVAISANVDWKTNLRGQGSEPNPWHASFDNCMFWL